MRYSLNTLILLLIKEINVKMERKNTNAEKFKVYKLLISLDIRKTINVPNLVQAGVLF